MVMGMATDPMVTFRTRFYRLTRKHLNEDLMRNVSQPRPRTARNMQRPTVLKTFILKKLEYILQIYNDAI